MNTQIFKALKEFFVLFLQKTTQELKEYNRKREKEKEQNKLTKK